MVIYCNIYVPINIYLKTCIHGAIIFDVSIIDADCTFICDHCVGQRIIVRNKVARYMATGIDEGVSVKVYYSGLSTIDSFERISNNIPFVKSLPLFLPTLSFKS